MIDIFKNFYKGKRVLVTGHTGFKGAWLSIWLHELGIIMSYLESERRLKLICVEIFGIEN